MKIHEESISFYLDKMRRGEHFALAGFSDAEWHCVMGTREGERTGLGQVISAKHGQRLFEVLRRRQHDPSFLFAVPKCLYRMPWFSEGQLDWFLGRHDIKIEAYERDMVTDDLAAAGDLYPLIADLRNRTVTVVGNRRLRSALPFACFFVGIQSPNLYLNPEALDRAVCEASSFDRTEVFLVSAGVSAAVIIDQLYDQFPKSVFLDTGSIWDAFAGIGEQREWRARLYADPAKLARWKRDCTEGKQTYGAGIRGYRRDETVQDRAADMLDTFNRYGTAMFRQQRAIYEHLGEKLNGFDVLDAGCGAGLGTLKLGVEATGSDKYERNVKFAKELYPWLNFVVWDFSKPWSHRWPSGNRFHTVVCVEALEHANDPRRCITNLAAAATRELWISTPNGNKPDRSAGAPPDNPHHVAEYTPAEMVEMLRQHGAVTIHDWETFKEVGVKTDIDPLVYRVQL